MVDTIPANMKHLYNICTTSSERLRGWSNIVQMLYKSFVFAEMFDDILSVTHSRAVSCICVYVVHKALVIEKKASSIPKISI